jgi:hypothetical protein
MTGGMILAPLKQFFIATPLNLHKSRTLYQTQFVVIDVKQSRHHITAVGVAIGTFVKNVLRVL